MDQVTLALVKNRPKPGRPKESAHEFKARRSEDQDLIPQWIKDIPPFVSAVIAAVGALIAVVSATVSAGSLYLN